MVDLGERGRHPPIVDSVDHVQLPQRSGTVERAGVDPADDVAQLLRRAGRWHRMVTNVEVEVEVGVLDPVRQIEPEWYLDEPSAERDEQPEPLLDEAAGRFEESVAAEPADVEQVERGDVTERAAGLHVEERRVHPGQLPHGRTLRLLRTARTQPIATRPENRNHCTAYDRCGPSSSDGAATGSGSSPAAAGSEPVSSTYIGTTSPGSWAVEPGDVDPLGFGQVPFTGVGQRPRPSCFGAAQPAFDRDVAGRCRGPFVVERDEAAGDEEDPPVVEQQRGDDVVSGPPAL